MAASPAASQRTKLYATLLVAMHIALCALVLGYAPPAQADPTADVVGGDPVAPESTDWPFIAAVLADPASPYSTQYCGGSLVQHQWVLTAAHCVYGSAFSDRWVLLGTKNLSSGGELIKVDQAMIDPSFDGYVEDGHDVALLRLAAPSSAPPIPIAAPAQEPTEGDTVRVAGWGDTDPADEIDDFPDGLFEADVELTSADSCATAFGVDPWSDTMLCAAHFDPSPARDACQGDSGGPLVYDSPLDGPLQVGVVSWGIGCGLEPYPGVYSRVSKLREWIRTTIGAPEVSVAPGTVASLGRVRLGTAAATQFTITNNFVGPLRISATDVVGDTSAYSVSDDCVSLASFAIGAGCTVRVTFTPSAPGDRSATIELSTNLASSPKLLLSLNGTGVKARPALKIEQTRSARSLRGGKRVRAAFRVGYVVPSGLAQDSVCDGKIELRAKIGSRSKARATRQVRSEPGGTCAATFRLALPARQLGRRITLAAAFGGNALMATQKRSVRSRLR